MSSSQSAEQGGFGNDPEGEFGGTPTVPAPEPVPQSTTTPNGNELGSSDSDSPSGGGGMTSSESAEQGGFVTSEQGEFG